MKENPNDEVADWTVRRLVTLMARTDADSIERQIAKEIFRWSSLVAGAAVVAVVVL